MQRCSKEFSTNGINICTITDVKTAQLFAIVDCSPMKKCNLFNMDVVKNYSKLMVVINLNKDLQTRLTFSSSGWFTLYPCSKISLQRSYIPY